ncbi:MAG: TonB-dependent receptor plug domain-containing protein [Bacteroidota bacterium]
MKKLNILVVVILALIFAGSTSYAQNETQEKSKAELKEEKKARKKATKEEKRKQTEEARKAARDYSRYTSLADILRQQPGVVVSGTGQYASVQIRGMNSMQLDTRPLFVYDGVELGRDYTKANNAIDRSTIKSVRVLKSLSETNFYGERGRNGVIVIKSHKTSKK